MSLTTTVTKIRLLIEIMFILNAVKFHFKGPTESYTSGHSM